MKFLFTILVAFATGTANAQLISAGFGIGFGTAQMSGLKTMNKGMLESLPFNAKQVRNFPLSTEYNIELNYDISKKYSLGIFYNFFSTGSRISSKDYSGEYRFDVISTGQSFGLINKYVTFERNSIIMKLTTSLGCNPSKYKLAEELTINGIESVSDKYNFKSYGFFVNPGVNIQYKFNSMSIGLYGSYFINAGSEIYMRGDKSTKLTVPGGNSIKSDWNGFRFGINFLFYTGN